MKKENRNGSVTITRDMEDTSNIWTLMLKLYEVMPDIKTKEAEILPIIKKAIHLHKLSVYQKVKEYYKVMEIIDLGEFLNSKIETHNNLADISKCEEWYNQMMKHEDGK